MRVYWALADSLSEVSVKYLLSLSSISSRTIFALVTHALNMHVPWQIAYGAVQLKDVKETLGTGEDMAHTSAERFPSNC